MKYLILLLAILAQQPSSQPPQNLRNAPTDLLGKSPLDFVFRGHRDFREFYCAREALDKRINAGKCVINIWQPGCPTTEIPVQPGDDLEAVLRKSKIAGLTNWNGSRPIITLIKEKAILRKDDKQKFLSTKIEGGDFIVVYVLP